LVSMERPLMEKMSELIFFHRSLAIKILSSHSATLSSFLLVLISGFSVYPVGPEDRTGVSRTTPSLVEGEWAVKNTNN